MRMSTNIILAIESSCDETAISVVRFNGDSLEILSNEISSQVNLHAQWGGVVPNLATREHVKNITPLLNLSLRNAGIGISEVDAIAVTQGPGLIPALMIGTGFAKTLAYLWKKPLIGIHHIEGHIYANFISKYSNLELQVAKLKNKESLLQNSPNIKFPILCLVVSGGHTQLVLMKNHFKYQIIGQTLDDAVGEAFDKVARILNIGYPGGPAISVYAEKQKELTDSYKIKFPRPMINKPGYNFSFSGLKTAVLYETKKNPENLKNKNYIAEVCHEFQQAAIDVLISKTIKAAEKYSPKTIMLAGGVSANKELRKQLGEAITKNFKDTTYCIPPIELTGDNAAMIGAAACLRYAKLGTEQKRRTFTNWKSIQPDANLKMK